jgi:hypothetical protein
MRVYEFEADIRRHVMPGLRISEMFEIVVRMGGGGEDCT